VLFSEPLLASHRVKANYIDVDFEYVGEGLTAWDGTALSRFEIAGSDQVWR